MPELGRFTRELRALLWKPSVDDEVRDELQHHVDMMEADLVAQGVDRAEARRRALDRFGDVARIVDECRDLGADRDRERRRTAWIGDLRQDVRQAIRQLRSSPRFAGVAIVTLAVGLGASTTIFGIADAVLLRPLPFHAPDRLVMVNETNPAGMQFSVSEPNFLDFRERLTRFSHLTAFTGTSPALAGDEPERLEGARVSADFFATLGRSPALGRGFTAEEDRPGGDLAVAVLSHGLWTRRFGGDPAVIGGTVELDGSRLRVIGVMPPGFDAPGNVEVWLPLAADAASDRGDHRLQMFGRLAPGASPADAEAELERVAAELAERYPEASGGWSAEMRPLTEWYVSPQLATRVKVLLATVALLLLMACVNVASLLLARAGARERELAVRSALGAGRWRMVRQLLTESVVLSLLGALVGVAVALAAVPLIRATGSAAIPRLEELAVDWRVLSFALAACLATGVLFGLAPALRLARRGSASGGLLRDGVRVADGSRLRSAMITGSVAIATLLLVSAALVGGSFLRLMRAELGFSPEHVLTASIRLPAERYEDPEAMARFHSGLQRRLEAIPGVRAAGATNIAPFAGGNTGMGWEPKRIATGKPEEFAFAGWRAVTPGFFASVGIPLLRGRLLESSDRYPAPRVIVINESMAKRGWPGGDPVGEEIVLSNGWTLTVVGVVGDTRHLSLDSLGGPVMFVSYGHLPWPSMWLTVRTSGDPMTVAAAMRRAVAAMDPLLPLARVQPLSRLVRDAAAEPRLTTLVFAIFASAALVLAAAGLYGVVSFTVVQRTRELGVRLALGAAPRRVVALVLGQGMRLALLGVLIGGVAAYGAAGFLRAILFETRTADPTTYVAVGVLLSLVAAAACAGPAWRAARLDPVRALRAE